MSGGSTDKPRRRDAFRADLKTRVISGAVLAIVGILDILAGGWATALFVALGTGLMAWELSRMIVGRDDFTKLQAIAAFIAGALPPLVAYIFGFQTAVGIAALVAGLAMIVLACGIKGATGIALLSSAGAAFVWLRDIDGSGLAIAIWLILVVAFADMGGYFAGRAIGGPKLAPKLSPNKTWAGAIGGIFFAMSVSVIFAIIKNGDPLILALIAAVTAIISQAGDLIESTAKRRYGVKDSSGLIPGHGGVWDRFDGLIAASLFLGAMLALSPGLISQW